MLLTDRNRFKLMVVIPFYKLPYFEALLFSLSNQSSSGFSVFVGNDASTHEASSLCKKYNTHLDIRYYRFDERLGHEDLAGQWNRCIARAGNSEWLWVIPDDDFPSLNCIKEILEAVHRADEIAANVIHIPCVVIDRKGERLSERCNWPSVMGSDEFYVKQLNGSGGRLSLANVVYRRSALDEAGGFMSLPKAWGSDHATMLAVASGGPVITVPNAWLGFRMSGENISSLTNDGMEKLGARLMFASWLGPNASTWYGFNVSKEIMKWFYFNSELHVLNTWSFSRSMAIRLFELAEICGVNRTPLQKLRVFVRGWSKLMLKR